MSKNKFDDLLSKKIQDEDLAYNPEHWNKLSQLLPANKKEEKGNKILMVSLGVAAAVALLLASVLLIKFIDTDSANQPDLLQNIAKNEIELPLDEENTSKKVSKADVQRTSRAESFAYSPTTSAAEEKEDTSNKLANVVSLKASPPVEPAETNQSDQDIVSRHEIKEKIKLTPDIKAAEKFTSPRQSAGNHYFPDYVQKEKQTSIAVSGGVNYGSLNTGYTVGFSAKQELGSKFFIDGTVAVMYNNNASDIGNYSGGMAGRPAGTASRMAAPAFTPTENLYYMQFNPSFGYQVMEDIAVSVGGDMQQMISPDNNVEKIQLSKDGVRIFPTLDIGLTGKAEFSVTPNIRAGVLFREGVNNVIKPKTTEYVNRRYFQVQFKYDIPVK